MACLINTNVETNILQREKFLKFIGWVLKRVREESSKQQKLVLKVSINNVISIDKTEVLNALKFLFVDSKKHDGSYEVVPHSDLLPFFVKTLSGKDDFINILCHLATSKDLKILWRTVLSKIAKKDISPSVETFLYKEVVTFFSKPEPKKLLRDMFI